MRDALNYFKKNIGEAKDLAKVQWKSFALAVLVIASIYILSMLFKPGIVSYLFILPPALVVAITALARANDIGPEKMGFRWQFRKLSLVLVGSGAVLVMGAPFAHDPIYPAWRTVILMYGFAGAWMTTPGMPPWDYYVTGKYRFMVHPPEYVRTPLERILSRFQGQMSPEEMVRALERWEAEHGVKQPHFASQTKNVKETSP